MINTDQLRDIFYEYEKNPYGEGDFLIVASEEYINEKARFGPDEINEEKQTIFTTQLFADIRADNRYAEKYRSFPANDRSLIVVILGTTDEGLKNMLGYVQDVLGISLHKPHEIT